MRYLCCSPLLFTLLLIPMASAEKPKPVSLYENSVLVPHGDFPKESELERDARMKWWRDAKFGMFVHWGLYSGLGGMWKGKYIEDGGREWIQYGIREDSATYAGEAIKSFDPDPLFAREWARLAREAGCRYVVFTAKHHDGFSLHDSRVSEYDAGSMVGRDLVGEITGALRDEGLKVGYYYSVIDWYHPHYEYRKAPHLPHPFEGRPYPNGKRDQQKYRDYLLGQVDELMSNYGPVDILWWDFSRGYAQGDFWGAKDLIDVMKTKQPQLISNSRLFRVQDPVSGDTTEGEYEFYNYSHGDFTTPEQKVPRLPLGNLDWESCMTHNKSWGYNIQDEEWKSTGEVLEILTGVVGKGGNLLFNVGPRADGSIPEPTIKMMREVGEWLDVNGEAIYGTRASPMIDLPFEGACTLKGSTLYFLLYEATESGTIDVPDTYAIRSVQWLANGEEIKIEPLPDQGITRIHCGKTLPDERVSVIKLEMNHE